MELHTHARPQYLLEAVGSGTSGDCPVIDDQPISFRFAIAIVLSSVFLAAPAWSEYKAVKEAYDLAIERGDYATAMRELRPLAEQGFASAQFNLGQLYANGQGVPKDDAQRGSGTRKPPPRVTRRPG